MKLDTDFRAMHTSGGRSRTHRPVEGDHETYVPPAWLFESAPEQVWWGADYYRAHLPAGGSWYVWDKRSTLDSEAAYTVADFDAVLGGHFELAWSRQQHRRVMLRYLWSGHHGMQGEDTPRRVHPTQKPVAMFAALIESLTSVGDVVFDPYAGSGTTLVAAHRTGRVAHLVELDPAYCDVIRDRWATLESAK